MPRKTRLRKHNPNRFTTEQIRTADLIMTEGHIGCAHKTSRKDRTYRYKYPTVVIGMCNRPALEPASKVFRTAIIADRTKKQHCRPQDFPPDGRGFWRLEAVGTTAKRVMTQLDPLLTPREREKWQKVLRNCR